MTIGSGSGRFFSQFLCDFFIGNGLRSQRFNTIQLCPAFHAEHGSGYILMLAICANDHETNSFLGGALNNARVPYLISLTSLILRAILLLQMIHFKQNGLRQTAFTLHQQI